jgi:Sec-independent protein translocase protein TatA
MFGIGFTEIILIAVLALVVIGPDKLPQLGKTLARFLGDFNKVKRDFRMTISDIERAGERMTDPAPEAKTDADDVIDVAASLDEDEPEVTFEPEDEAEAEVNVPSTPEGSRTAAGLGKKRTETSAKPVRPARPRRRKAASRASKKPRATVANKTSTTRKTKPTIAKVEAAGAASVVNQEKLVGAKKSLRKPLSKKATPRRRTPARKVAESKTNKIETSAVNNNEKPVDVSASTGSDDVATSSPISGTRPPKGEG